MQAEELLPDFAPSLSSPTLSKAGSLLSIHLIWLPLQKAEKELGNSFDDFREELILLLPVVKTSNHKQQLNFAEDHPPFPPSPFLICMHLIAMG